MDTGRKLLLVEDDPVIRGVVKEFVTSSGWEVTEFDNGLAAAAASTGFRFDAAILDVQVPGMNGPTLLDRLRKDRPGFPVILMSGQVTEASVQALMGRGVRLLGKPFTSQELKGALEQLASDVSREALSVLVVEDHEGIREIIQTCLTQEGMHVEAFPEGRAALARISKREKPYDIALVDLHLPGMLGMEIVRALGKMSPKTLPIMMTGEANAREVQEGYKNGAYGLLRKPFDMGDLSKYFRALDYARIGKRAEGAKKEALANAPMPVQVLHEVKAKWSAMSPGKRRETKSLALVLLLAIFVGVPLCALVYSGYAWVTGTQNRVFTFMEEIKGYLERDEQREVDGKKTSTPKTTGPMPGNPSDSNGH